MFIARLSLAFLCIRKLVNNRLVTLILTLINQMHALISENLYQILTADFVAVLAQTKDNIPQESHTSQRTFQIRPYALLIC